ncbi:hypothetical protein ACHQM5_021709 [Ranunculus cassubicifolius]
MEDKKLPVQSDTPTLSYEKNHDEEAPMQDADCRKGGWITFPFITVGVAGLTIAASGWMTNLIVYLIQQFNIKSIKATQISNIVNGCSSFFPIVGAIVADSLLGNLVVISVSSFLSLLGLGLLTLTATVHSLRPRHCKENLEACESPSQFQFAVLYSAITLVSIGMGGTRFTLATMGANQFNKAKDQGKFFNWYFFTLYLALVIGLTAVVYVEDTVSWGLGFGLCLVVNGVGLAIFMSGKGYYRYIKPKGSPFTSLARVLVAAIQKKKVPLSSESKDYYYGHIGEANSKILVLATSSFRFLNRAAIKTEGDKQNGHLRESWSLCTVQQVEDLKNLIRIIPIWSTSIFLTTPIAIQSGLMVLQALNMDRHIGAHFQVPAGTFLIFTLLSTAISLSVIDRVLFPLWKMVTQHSMTPLERLGIGHVLNIIGMAGSAIVESRRLHVVHSHGLTHQPGAVAPMSAFWLVTPLAIIGVGEAFHFPGQVALYYQEFPVSLRSTATATISLVIAIGYYLGTALVDLIQRVSGWLPDNINEGRVDNVYWVLVVIGVANFGYYITCAMSYTYQSVENQEKKSESTRNG